MNTKLKKGLVALGISGLFLAGLGFVSAQRTNFGESEVQVQARSGKRGSAPKAKRGNMLGRLALGTQLDVSFYDGDPEAGGNEITTIRHVVGEDSEVVFQNALKEAREDAEFMIISTSAQSRTMELSEDQTGRHGRGFKGMALLGRGLNEGSSVEAIFYDGDPEAGANVLQSISFTNGEDSARGFMEEAKAAAEEAAFVTVNISPQTRTVDLSERGDRGRQGPDHYSQGGFGL